MTGGQLTSPSIALYSANGEQVARANPNMSSSGFSAMEGTVLETGRYYLVAMGSTNSDYTVTYNKVTLPVNQAELSDAPASFTTPYHIKPGEVFQGNMNDADSDVGTNKGDWVKVTLVAGQDYRFELNRGTISNADIKLYDALGNLVANSNDSLGSASTTPVIQGTAAASGTYYIGVNSKYSGNYTITYKTVDLPTTYTELKDAPASIATPYSIQAGQSYHGNLKPYRLRPRSD